MRIQLDLRALPWDFHQKADPPHVAALRERINTIFAACKPRRLSGRDEFTQELTVPPGDPTFEPLLKQFDAELRKSKPPVAAGMRKVLEPAEVKRARFMGLTVYGDDVDLNNYEEPLNPVSLACDACKFPDIARVANPLLVNKAKVKKQDVQNANTVLIVRAGALELLRQSVADQIEIGDVRYVVKGKPDPKPPAAEDRLYWVRPKAVLGEAIVPGFTPTKRCPSCQRVLDYDQQMPDAYLTAQGPGVHEMNSPLQHFGDGKADIAVVPPYRWTEDIDHTRQRHWGVGFAVSGAMFEQLKSAKVKGIAFGELPVAHTSAKGEATFVAAPRAFDGAAPGETAPTAAVAKPAKSAKAAKVPDDMPWDCDGDGYVYFQLTTPEVVMLDPMTWEQDYSGPHRVKKFKKPGRYRMPVTAIRNADADSGGVAVDSATLLIVDSAFFADLQDAYDWDKAVGKNGKPSAKYHQSVSEQIGSRFGLVTTPPKKFKSDFVGDGEYTLDAKLIEPAP